MGHVEVTTSVSDDAPPVTVRIMRGDQLVHEFTETAEPKLWLPANSNEHRETAA